MPTSYSSKAMNKQAHREGRHHEREPAIMTDNRNRFMTNSDIEILRNIRQARK